MEQKKGYTTVAGYLSFSLKELNSYNKISVQFLGLTTILTAYQQSLEKLRLSLFQEQLSYIVASVVSLIIWRLLDKDLRKNIIVGLQAVTADDWGGAKPLAKTAAILMLVLATGRLVLSGGATYLSGKIVGDKADDSELYEEDLDNTYQAKKAKEQEVIGHYNDLINTASKTEAARVASAIEAKAALEEQAYLSGTYHQKKTYRENRGFFDNLNPKSKYYQANKDYYQRILTAQAEGEAQILAERNRLKELRAEKAIELKSLQKDEQFTALFKIKQERIEKEKAKANIIVIAFAISDIFFFITTILTSLGLVVGLKENPSFRIFPLEEPEFWEAFSQGFTSILFFANNMLVYCVGKIDNGVNNLADSILLEKKAYLKTSNARAIRDKEEALNTSSGLAKYRQPVKPKKRVIEPEPQKEEKPKKVDHRDYMPKPAEPKQEEKQATPTPEPVEPEQEAPAAAEVVAEEAPGLVLDEAKIATMQKRVRRRWERSFEQHKDSPKEASKRAELKAKAEEEIALLRQMGYTVKPKGSNPMSLSISKA